MESALVHLETMYSGLKLMEEVTSKAVGPPSKGSTNIQLLPKNQKISGLKQDLKLFGDCVLFVFPFIEIVEIDVSTNGLLNV